MKITKQQLLVCLCSIFILLLSLAVMVCDFALGLNIWTHPVLTFVFCLSVGFFLLCLTLGIVKKSAWQLFLSAILSTFAIIYPFAHYEFWWIGLIVVLIVWAIIGVFSFMLMGNKTEEIALNSSKGYKNYKERANENAQVEENQEEKPEIKSFK